MHFLEDYCLGDLDPNFESMVPPSPQGGMQSPRVCAPGRDPKKVAAIDFGLQKA